MNSRRGTVRNAMMLALMRTGMDQNQAVTEARRLLSELNALGMVVAPRHPTGAMLTAARRAVRGYGFLQGGPAEVADQKHHIRYSAMLEVVRKAQGLAEVADA